MPTELAEHETGQRLIRAGLHLFGRKGFEGTSTRALAARADTNVASIAYHFGSKAGLRVACARTVAAQVRDVLGPPMGDPPSLSPARARDQIEQMIRAIVRLIVGAPQAHDMVPFMLRELTDRGEIAEMIYAEFLEPSHIRFCTLWAAATGRAPEDAEVKLAVFSVIGQIFYFRIASPFVQRRLGWEALGEAETREIADLVAANLGGIIERQRL